MLELRSLADSAARVLLTGLVGNASWSPDGHKIAVARKSRAGVPKIVVLDATGGAPRSLTRGRDPAWSPNGELIAYLALDSAGKPTREIRIMNKDGKKERRLVMIGEANEQRRYLGGPLVWSGNSEKIAVTLAEQLWIVHTIDSSAAPIRVR